MTIEEFSLPRVPAANFATIMNDEVHVWCFKLCEEPLLIQSAFSALSEDERARATRFRSPSLQAAFILSRGILRRLLARFCDCTPSNVIFAYGQQGKPFLADRACPVRFNMSHSGGIAAYALNVSHEIGVDIEQHRPLPDMDQIAARFFSPLEYRELMGVAELEREVAFFDCWVRKEAYIKALGGGLSIPLDSFQVTLGPRRSPALVEVRNNGTEAREWSIQEFSPAPGYSGAVAFRNRCTVRVHAIQRADEIFPSAESL